jgi:putative hydrolase
MGDLGSLLGQWATAIGPMFFGLQVGSVVGHLSQRALGQYPLAIPWAPSDELLVVTANVATFAEDWSLPEEEALLWVCVRELASNSVLTRPPVRGRMEELLMALAESSASAQQDLAGRLGGLGLPGGNEGADGMDLESLQGMFGDPEALLGELLTPESRRTSDQLTGLAVVIDGYADHVANQVGQKLVGSHAQLAEAWYRRRTERGKGEEAAGALFGLDLDQTQVDRGRSFISGVLERAGDEGLAKLWLSETNLPTPPGRGEGDDRQASTVGGVPPSGAAAVGSATTTSSSGTPRSQSSTMFSRSASRITRSRLRRYWGSWGGRRTSLAMVRRRNSSIRAGSP